jgi:predicted RNA-binding protein with PUA-like domain
MAYWLLKTEPSDYSFDRLVAEKRAVWDGITNPVALKNLRAAASGDRVVIYHTGDERAAVGTAEIVKAAYEPNHHQGGGPRLPVIDVEARERLPAPVELSVIKADPLFADSPLNRQGRLSFVPLSDAQWARLMALAKKKR